MASLKLLPEERLIYKTNPHLIFLILPIAGILFFWAVLWLGSCPTLEIFSLKFLCRLFASLVFLFSIVVIYLDWHFNRFYLTNYRVIKERGIIGKRFVTVWLYKIQDLTVEIGIWGRIFGFGDLIIESAGTFGQMSFKGFPAPVIIKGRIEGEIKRNNSGLV
jgi:uncharacterized membrane protein YdbT with pleckstrin-like domain